MSYSFRFDSVGISEYIGYCHCHILSSLAVLVYQNLLDIVNVIFVQVWQCWYIRIYWILSMSYSFEFGSVGISESIGYCQCHIRSSLAVLVYQNLLDIVNVIFVRVWQCWYIRIYWILSMSYSFKFGSVGISESIGYCQCHIRSSLAVLL